MNVTMNQEHKKIDPRKFTLWVGLTSIIMMFAGLTSAYIVKRSQPEWLSFEMPRVFWYSTIVMLVSSLLMHFSIQSFKEREMAKSRSYLLFTIIAGCVFIALQLAGFSFLWSHGIQLRGAGGGQFLYIIAGLHILHVVGGLIALIIRLIRSYIGNTKLYSPVPMEMLGTYWHFVDLLWLYLFVFFLTMA